MLFVASTLALGGAERVIRNLASRLDPNRFDVTVTTLRDPGGVGEEIARDRLPVRHGWTGPRRLDLALIPRLRRWLLRERFDVLYFLDHPHAIFHGVIASWGTGVRVRVMPVHTTGRWDGAASVPRSTRAFLPWIDRVIAIAEAQRDYLVREEGLPAGKMVVIPNGIECELPDPALRASRRSAVRTELGIPSEDPVVMILAVLRPEKNHELLLRAAARIRGGLPNLRLLIVGDGPRRPYLEEEAARLGLGECVRFLGRHPDGRRLWPAADLAALCSHPRVETLPLSLLEAMDTGLPLVSTDVGALRDIVRSGENGALVPAGDEAALAEAMRAILGDPERRVRFGGASQRIVADRFTAARMAAATEDLLLSLGGWEPRKDADL